MASSLGLSPAGGPATAPPAWHVPEGVGPSTVSSLGPGKASTAEGTRPAASGTRLAGPRFPPRTEKQGQGAGAEDKARPCEEQLASHSEDRLFI